MKFAWITAALACLASINSVEAGLFHHSRSNDCGCAQTTCAAPAACAPVVAQQACTPCNTGCNSGCNKPRCFKMPKLFSHKKNNDCGCAQTTCAAPAACAPVAAPTCCAPAPTCCNNGCQKKSCFSWMKCFSHKKSNDCGCAQTACATTATFVQAAPPIPSGP